MTNVYWVHMPRNLSRPPPEDGNADNIIADPVAYIPEESLSASASCLSKYFIILSPS